MSTSCVVSDVRRTSALLLLALLLLGTEPTHGDLMQCLGYMEDCGQIMSDLAQGLQSAENLSALCSSTIQNMTDCIQSAQDACSDQQSSLDSLQTQLDYMKKNICSSDMMCSMKSASCARNMSKMASDDPTSGVRLDLACRLYPEMLNCLKALGSDCQSSEAVKRMVSYIAPANAYCRQLTNDGSCVGGLSCFSSLANDGNNGSCSTIENLMTCLNKKVKAGTCRLNESVITMDRVTQFMKDMCPVADKTCEKAQLCMMPPGMPTGPGAKEHPPPGESPGPGEISGPGEGDLEAMMSTIVTATAQLADPAFYCRFMVKATECYVDKARECRYPPKYVDDMKAKQKTMQKECPEKPTGSAAGMVPEIVCFATAILTIWMSIC